MASSRSRRAVYVISVAADLAGVHPQTLRIYERKGLLRPERTAGNTRRYSVTDIDRLRRIQALTQKTGVNLAGVKMILDLESQLDRMRRELNRMADRVQELEAGLADEMRSMAREAGAILPASSHRTLEQLWKEANTRRGPVSAL
jgi:MerR family transcriptional regulator/heat shock protein HspR